MRYYIGTLCYQSTSKRFYSRRRIIASSCRISDEGEANNSWREHPISGICRLRARSRSNVETVLN